jgi:hypothetical protein
VKDLSDDSRSQVRDLNPGSPEYEADVSYIEHLTFLTPMVLSSISVS